MLSSFEKPGYDNTGKALEVMLEGVREYRVRQVVVASTRGGTGLAAAKQLQGSGVGLTVVTHNYGFKEPGTHEMTPETREEIESFGAKVFTGTMALRNIGTAIRQKQGYSEQDLIANTLRIFGQGIKVCVEIAMMGADAGLITPDDVIAVAGTGRGADTVALIAPRPSNSLFDLQVKKILVKPISW